MNREDTFQPKPFKHSWRVDLCVHANSHCDEQGDWQKGKWIRLLKKYVKKYECKWPFIESGGVGGVIMSLLLIEQYVDIVIFVTGL